MLRSLRGGAVVVATALVGVLCGLIVTGSAAAAPSQAPSPDPAEEAIYVVKINAIREANGLAPLTVNLEMTEAARDWTQWMVENTTLAHADDIVTGAPSDWLKVGENVGRGGSLDAVWEAFLASPSHAANVLDPDFDLVGIGVIWTPDGRHYTTHRFADVESVTAAPEPAPVATPEPLPEPIVEADPEPTPEPDAPSEPTPSAPEQLPFGEPTSAPQPAPAPERLRTTLELLLAAS